MNFVEVTSLIAAIGGVLTAVLSIALVRMQWKADKRKSPIFTYKGPIKCEVLPDVHFWDVQVINPGSIGFTLFGVRARQPILFRPDDIWVSKSSVTIYKINIGSGIPERKTKLFRDDAPTARCFYETEIRAAGKDGHYRIPLSSSANRARISLIWRWNDESRERRSRIKLTSPARIKS